MTQPESTPDNTYAVLMGDIVGSEQSHSPDRLHALFNRIITDQNATGPASILSPLTITLGDEFQGLVRNLAASVPIMRDIRLEFLLDGIECRFALGATVLQTSVNSERAWNMMGTGFAGTREKLNEKRDDVLYRFFLPSEPSVEIALEALGASLTSIERKWTARQLSDIAELLSGKSVQEVARLRNVSAHSVYKVRSSGEFDLYVMLWNAVTELLRSVDRRLYLKA